MRLERAGTTIMVMRGVPVEVRHAPWSTTQVPVCVSTRATAMSPAWCAMDPR
jgi:hypothetical protein